MKPRDNALERAERLMDELVSNCADSVSQYNRERPKDVALIFNENNEKVTWENFEFSVTAYAAKLISMGFKKGDILATMLPLMKEHIYLFYACYRIGVIIAPLDVRLKTTEVQNLIDKIKPKACFFLGVTQFSDFRSIIGEVMNNSPSTKIWAQIEDREELLLEGAVRFSPSIEEKSDLSAVKKARDCVNKNDPCLIIFTTGTTGSPKPALLTHNSILTQDITFGVFSEINSKTIFLHNLPPSHIAASEVLQTTIFMGGTVVIQNFDPKGCLEAIQGHKVTHICGIPAMFNMLWRCPDYDRYDLSSLHVAVFGGQSVPRSWVENLQAMCPNFVTGMALTEASGCATSNGIPCTVDDVMNGLGHPMPYFPVSIREPMNLDGTAGAEKPTGEIGEICFQGSQAFIGYYGDPKNTAKTISKEGVLYTGDLGSYDEKGLHFIERRKFVIKPKGYQVFPVDVENHIYQSLSEKIGMVAVVGVEHEIYTEGIMAFIERKEGKILTEDEVHKACKNISAYSRPSHVEIVKEGEMPLTRTAKTDYLSLKEWANEIVKKLREEGKWDS